MSGEPQTPNMPVPSAQLRTPLARNAQCHNAQRNNALARIARTVVAALSLLVLLGTAPAGAQRPAAAANTPAGYSHFAYLPLFTTNSGVRTAPGISFGMDFITSAEALADEDRYAHAALTEARYDRVPFYWWAVEATPGQFAWSAQDTVVIQDITHGYQLDVILLMPPNWRIVGPCSDARAAQPRVGDRSGRTAEGGPGQDCTTPQNLGEPVFSDGTDVPGAGKTINANNYWAHFVYSVVARYMPGGVLAQAQGWGPDKGVRLWEIWNEPDWEFFWNGDAAQYARALKVAYLAIQQADPAAEVMFGGLSNIGVQSTWPSGRPTWLNDVLAVIQADPNLPLRNASSWYFDSVGDHNYSHAWSTWNLIYQHNNVVAGYGLTGKGAWLTETGVPVCDDYPGAACDPPWYRGNLEESAAFEIQSAAYGMFVGLDGYFHFQLYDDCPTPGDAWGIFRNPSWYSCASGSPYPNQPRPTLEAFKVNVHYLWGLEPLWRKRPGGPNPYTGPQEWIAFYRPNTHQRVLVVWNRFAESDQVAGIPATGPSALRINQDGATETLYPVNGTYTMTLPRATNLNIYWPDGSRLIGGRPYVLVETDTQRPSVAMTALPPESPPAIALSWTGEDLGSGIGNYQVWVRVDGGPLKPWASLRETSTTYTGQSGHTYGYAVRAVDKAGNYMPEPTAVQTSTYVP